MSALSRLPAELAAIEREVARIEAIRARPRPPVLEEVPTVARSAFGATFVDAPGMEDTAWLILCAQPDYDTPLIGHTSALLADGRREIVVYTQGV